MTAGNSKMVLIPLDRYEELTSSNPKSPSIHKQSVESHKNSETDDCKDNLSEDNILEFIPSPFQTKAKLIL